MNGSNVFPTDVSVVEKLSHFDNCTSHDVGSEGLSFISSLSNITITKSKLKSKRPEPHVEIFMTRLGGDDGTAGSMSRNELYAMSALAAERRNPLRVAGTNSNSDEKIVVWLILIVCALFIMDALKLFN